MRSPQWRDFEEERAIETVSVGLVPAGFGLYLARKRYRGEPARQPPASQARRNLSRSSVFEESFR